MKGPENPEDTLKTYYGRADWASYIPSRKLLVIDHKLNEDGPLVTCVFLETLVENILLSEIAPKGMRADAFNKLKDTRGFKEAWYKLSSETEDTDTKYVESHWIPLSYAPQWLVEHAFEAYPTKTSLWVWHFIRATLAFNWKQLSDEIFEQKSKDMALKVQAAEQALEGLRKALDTQCLQKPMEWEIPMDLGKLQLKRARDEIGEEMAKLDKKRQCLEKDLEGLQ